MTGPVSNSPASRPLPVLTEWNRAFWTAGAEEELRIQFCASCKTYLHPPRALCPRCLRADLTYPAVSGAGSVFTFSIICHAYRSGLETPYNVALVELVEQASLRLTTTIVGCDLDEIEIGRSVRVEFEATEGEVFVPVFRLLAVQK